MASFWNDMSLEPYRGFRWVIEISSIKEKIYAMKVDKPSFKVGEYNHKILNHQFNYPGRLVWDPVACTVVDVPAGPAYTLFRAVQKGGYDTGWALGKEGTDGLTKSRFGNSVATAGKIVITQLKAREDDPRPIAGQASHALAQRWTLNNCFFTDIKFGSLDYGSEDAVQIQFTIRYDWAELGGAEGGGG